MAHPLIHSPLPTTQVIQQTPRSLFALFDNFDRCIRLGGPPRGGGGGGLLAGVSVNGLPLAEPPVLEVYGPTQLVYSSTQEDEDQVVGFVGVCPEVGVCISVVAVAAVVVAAGRWH